MNFVMQSIETQFENFSKRISTVFVRKKDVKKYIPEYEFKVDNGHLYYREKQEENNG